MAEPAEVNFKGHALKVLDLGGDGDCGYRAIAAAHGLSNGTKTMEQVKRKAESLGRGLRARCCQHIIGDAEFRHFFTP
eukprot:429177-Alexandrium_andersonii.AAC.1